MDDPVGISETIERLMTGINARYVAALPEPPNNFSGAGEVDRTNEAHPPVPENSLYEGDVLP